MLVYEALARILAESGVDTVFYVYGDTNNDLLQTMAGRHDVRLVQARHQSGAVAMADGYARFSNNPGVACVAQGSGFTNSLSSLLTAVNAGSQVLLIAGDTPTVDPMQAYWSNNINQRAISELLGCTTVSLTSAANTVNAVNESLRSLRNNKPVVLITPSDLLKQALPDGSKCYAPPLQVNTKLIPDEETLNEATAILRASNRPVILLGNGAQQDDVEDSLTRFVGALQLPVAVTLGGVGLLADNPLHLGIIGGLGTGLASSVIKNADCVIAVGTRLDPWVTWFGSLTRQASIIHIDHDRDSFNRFTPVSVALHGDAGLTLNELLIRCDCFASPEPWLEQVHSLQASEDEAAGIDGAAGTGLGPQAALQALDNHLPRQRRLVLDIGNFSAFASPILHVHEPRSFAFAYNFAVAGQSLGIGIGAAFAQPDERITVIVGDGGFMMACNEISTAARFNLPITFAVFNNGGYAEQRHVLLANGYPTTESELECADLERLAGAYGCGFARFSCEEELESLPDSLRNSDGPLILEFRIDPEPLPALHREISRLVGLLKKK